jgi:ribonuclease P protein component
MSLKFPRAVRLRSRDQFDHVQRGGRRVSARFLTLIGSPNSLEIDRLGIIASRRVGGAVLRNRAKRRLREVFRRQEPSESVGGALDLVVIARSSLTEAPFPEVEADFRAALGKLRRVKSSS